MKPTICLLLDGAPDHAYAELGGQTPMQRARMVHADALAAKGTGGRLCPLGEDHIPESDTALLAFMGYDVSSEYFGRAPIEAIGVGLPFHEGYLALHLNFAEISSGSSVIVRRTASDLSDLEAAQMLDALDSEVFKQDSTLTFAVRSLGRSGYRAVAVIQDSNGSLSGNISNTDPAHRRAGFENRALASYESTARECVPLDDSDRSARTASLVNRLVREAHTLLSCHEMNVRRAREGRPVANYLLMRSAGSKLPPRRLVSARWGFSIGLLAEGAAERGIAVLCGVPLISPLTGASLRDTYRSAASLLAEATLVHHLVFAHIKGPDEPGHRGQLQAKVEALEMIDEYLIGPLLDRIDLRSCAIFLSADHHTHCSSRVHTADPVPFVYSPSARPDGFGEFSESEVLRLGSQGSMLGNDLISYLVSR